jgi:hypothetical protein
MKKFYLFFLLTFFVGFSQVGWGQVTYGIYEFTGTSNGDNQFNQVTNQPTYGSFSTFDRINVTYESGPDIFNSKSWNNSAVRDEAEYVSLSLSLTNPNTFDNISLTLTFDNSRSGTGPAIGEVMYKFGANSFSSAGTWTTPTPSFANFSFTIPAPGNITETFLEIRIHGMSSSSAAGTLRFDNVKLAGASVPLPVELTSFTALAGDNFINLKWQTKTETNNYGFEILRSAQNNKGNWTKLGFVNGHGNSNSPKEYSFSDKSVTSGKYFYRLKQIDTDGKYEFSEEVEVDLGLPKSYNLGQNYPNPFNPSTIINFSLPKESNVNLKIFNLLGEEIISLVNNEYMSAGSYSYKFDAPTLASGAYIYRIAAGDFVQTKKMTLRK